MKFYTLFRILFVVFLFFFIFSKSASALTISTTDGKKITSNTTDADMQMRTVFLLPDSEGGVLVIWAELSSPDIDLYAQRYDSTLTKVWTNDLTIVSSPNLISDTYKAIADGSGGAVITWTDNRNSGTTEWDIYAQRIDKDGNRLWGANDKLISDANKRQSVPDVYQTANGDYYFAWRDCRDNLSGDCSGTPRDVYGQRLDSTGVAQWTEDGLLLGDNQAGGPIVLYPNQNSAVDVWLSSARPLLKVTQAGSITSEAYPQAYDYFAKDSSFNIIGLYTDVDDILKLDKFNQNDLTDMVWGSSVDTGIDTNYLNDWYLYLDDSDNVYVVYMDYTNDEINNYSDVLIKKFLTSGASSWSGNATTVLQTADEDSILTFTDAGNSTLILNSLDEPGGTTSYTHMHAVDVSTGTLTSHSSNPYYTHTGGAQTNMTPMTVSVYNNTSVYSLFEDEDASDLNNLYLYLNTISTVTPTPTPTPSSSQGSSPPGILGCSDAKPLGQPFITKVENEGGSAEIYFAPALNNFNKYHIAYGTDNKTFPYAYEFYSSAKGGIETTRIDYLTSGANYYFKIKAVNGCNSGDWSAPVALFPGNPFGSSRPTGQKSLLVPEGTQNQSLPTITSTPPVGGETESPGFWEQFLLMLDNVLFKLKSLFF